LCCWDLKTWSIVPPWSSFYLGTVAHPFSAVRAAALVVSNTDGLSFSPLQV
jgi:hypothetical protein